MDGRTVLFKLRDKLTKRRDKYFKRLPEQSSAEQELTVKIRFIIYTELVADINHILDEN